MREEFGFFLVVAIVLLGGGWFISFQARNLHETHITCIREHGVFRVLPGEGVSVYGRCEFPR